MTEGLKGKFALIREAYYDRWSLIVVEGDEFYEGFKGVEMPAEFVKRLHEAKMAVKAIEAEMLPAWEALMEKWDEENDVRDAE